MEGRRKLMFFQSGDVKGNNGNGSDVPSLDLLPWTKVVVLSECKDRGCDTSRHDMQGWATTLGRIF